MPHKVDSLPTDYPACSLLNSPSNLQLKFSVHPCQTIDTYGKLDETGYNSG